ncbi:MAG TPA: phosphatidylinositol mannoside acyltransferase [Actinomycetota bacterium]|nr:phosphatidylinositol mannoside acyltransferase [Actinomycetota bacterium]
MIPNSQAASRRWLAAWTLVRKLPEPVAHALGGVGGRVSLALDRDRREALTANLAQVLGPATGPRELRRAVRQGFASYGRYWVEAFRLEDLTAADIRQRLRIEGREHIDTALAGGRGAIFASPHIGNWDAGGAWLAAVGYPATAVVERLKPAELYERFAVYRRALGMELLPLDDGSETLRGVVRALRAGRLACLVCDRDLTGGGLEVRLFGARAVMPGGPASIALRTGAPLLPCSVYHDRRPGHWRAVVHPPLVPERSGDTRKDTVALTQRLADEFEGLIAAAPTQWHVLSPYFHRNRSPVPRGQQGTDPPPAGPS